MNLASERVHSLFRSTLYKEEEAAASGGAPPDGTVVVEGLTGKFGLHPERLEATRTAVVEMIDDLDPKFLRESGGGFTFLGLPFDKNGEQWGEQHCAELLLVLAIGLGLAKILVPREIWGAFPGGVPYVAFWRAA